MPILVCYDIENDNLRTKLANKLTETGFVRLQKSVFLGSPDETLWNRVQNWLQLDYKTLLQSQDSILLLQLTELQAKGINFIPDSPLGFSEILDPPHTLFI
jgi:CRISPR-associated endonuclease Cas2